MMNTSNTSIFPPAIVSNTSVLRSVLSVEAQIVFGAPGNGCAGSGICRVQELSTRLPANICTCHLGIARIGHTPDGLLLFSFYKSFLSACARERLFSGAWFRVEEAFELPSWALRRFGLSICCVPAGLYAIHDTGDCLELRFEAVSRGRF